MGLIDVIKKGAFVDILRGMSVTGTYFVVDKVTVEYPAEKLQTYPRFRGVHALLTDPDSGGTKCVACMLCATVCPSRCIRIVGEQVPDGRSRPATFDLDLSRCIFCGLCEEVCPEAAIVMTRHYELATFDKSDFYLTRDKLVANQVYVRKEVYAAAAPTETAAPKEAVPPATGAGAGGPSGGVTGEAGHRAGAGATAIPGGRES